MTLLKKEQKLVLCGTVVVGTRQLSVCNVGRKKALEMVHF